MEATANKRGAEDTGRDESKKMKTEPLSPTATNMPDTPVSTNSMTTNMGDFDTITGIKIVATPGIAAAADSDMPTTDTNMADIETNTGVADTDTGSKTVIGSFILDPDGDLTIRAGEDLGTPRDFKVCSSAVRRASPIFKERILGSWLESKPKDHDKIWLVTLGGDEPDGLQILLQLIHASRLAEIPTPISIENLNSVVALVKAYDLFHVVQPWARSWMDAAAKEAASSSSIKTIVLINWIAWEMGNRYLFDATANTLASQVSCDANNGLRDTNGDRLEEESFVVHVPKLVIKRRAQFLQEYLNFLHGCFTKADACNKRGHAPGTTTAMMACTSSTQGEMCQNMIKAGHANLLLTKGSDFLPQLDMMANHIRAIVKVPGRFHGLGCTFARSFDLFDINFKASFKDRPLAQSAHKKVMAKNSKSYGLEEYVANWTPSASIPQALFQPVVPQQAWTPQPLPQAGSAMPHVPQVLPMFGTPSSTTSNGLQQPTASERLFGTGI